MTDVNHVGGVAADDDIFFEDANDVITTSSTSALAPKKQSSKYVITQLHVDRILLVNNLVRLNVNPETASEEIQALFRLSHGPCMGKKIRLGGHLPTPYAMCDALKISAQSIVYSVGIGDDASWDVAMMDRYSCPIYAFDPTPIAISYVEKHPDLKVAMVQKRFHFHRMGVFSKDDPAFKFYLPAHPHQVSGSTLGIDLYTHFAEKGSATQAPRTMTVPMKKLRSLMNANNHDHIDVLKMDIEDAEYHILNSMIDEEGDIPTDYLMIESGTYNTYTFT
jgi:FkbM family methyltransferase